jgi:tetratricopeptide (TPR) repeat protein
MDPELEDFRQNWLNEVSESSDKQQLENASELYNQAEVLENSGKITEAVRMYQKAYKADPEIDQKLEQRKRERIRTVSSTKVQNSTKDIGVSRIQTNLCTLGSYMPNEILIQVFKYLVTVFDSKDIF